jgi:radial spoke head protein 4/6
MSAQDFAEAKSYLMSGSSKFGSTYEHLQEIVLKLLTERPEDAVSMFEKISREAKRNRLNLPKTSESALFGEDAVNSEVVEASKSYNSACSKFFSSELEESDTSSVQDLMTDLASLKFCGVDFGDTESYKMYLSMRKLASELEGDLQSLRFWGKILGTEADYFVCQGQYTGGDDEEDDAESSKDLETGDNSPNKFTYWVSNSVGGEWTRLPRVRASHIVAARKIKRFFTGNLDADVKGHPPFPGTEKEFLRAQIAQITASCSVSPKGFFVEGDDFTMIPNEEMEPSESAEELCNAESWSHHHLAIDENGRCMPFQSEDDEEESKEDSPEMLRSLDESEWKTSAPASNKVCLRSNVWRGAHAVGFGRHFAWIYVGYGFDDSKPYTPLPPATPQVEFDLGESGAKECEDVLEDPDAGAKEEEGDDEDEN